MQKATSTTIIRVSFVQKTALKNTKYSRNETILKIGHLAKALAFAKWSVRVKKLKLAKTCKNDSTTSLGMFCAKNGWKKQLLFEK